MKNKKLIEAKKLIKSIDNDIQIIVERHKYTRGLTCEPTEKRIYLGFRATKIENQTFINLVNELEPNFFQKYKVSLWLLSVLHEIGHIQTHDEELEEDYNFCVDFLNELKLNNEITEKEQNEYYVRLDLEQMATQWAIDYVKKAF